jgi:hypothetical protein
MKLLVARQLQEERDEALGQLQNTSVIRVVAKDAPQNEERTQQEAITLVIRFLQSLDMPGLPAHLAKGMDIELYSLGK